MNENPTEPAAGPRGRLAAAGLGVLAVVCCAGAPLIAGALGSIAVSSVLGAGAGVLTVLLVSVLIVARIRHRRACAVLTARAPVAQPRRGGGS